MSVAETREETPECPSKGCEQWRDRYQETRVSVDPRYVKSTAGEGAQAVCCGCGGVLKDGKWVYRCNSCGKETDPEGLCGLFVPHNCQECEQRITEQNRKSGNVCLLCRAPRNQCCC